MWYFTIQNNQVTNNREMLHVHYNGLLTFDVDLFDMDLLE